MSAFNSHMRQNVWFRNLKWTFKDFLRFLSLRLDAPSLEFLTPVRGALQKCFKSGTALAHAGPGPVPETAQTEKSRTPLWTLDSRLIVMQP